MPRDQKDPVIPWGWEESHALLKASFPKKIKELAFDLFYSLSHS